MLILKTLFKLYLLQLAGDGIKRDVTQTLLDTANYTFEKKNGTRIVLDVRKELNKYFTKKKDAAIALTKEVKGLYDAFVDANHTVPAGTKLAQLPSSVYWDSDVPTTLPLPFTFES